MPTGNEEKSRLEIHINGKVYDNFEDMFSDFVDDMSASGEAEEKQEPCTEDYDQMAKELFDTYMAFKRAGFDREQAFELLLTIVGGNY